MYGTALLHARLGRVLWLLKSSKHIVDLLTGGIMNRHILASALALLVAAGASVPASAQQGDTNRNEVSERDDNGEWGWLGLLGLAGLAGLKRRDRVDHTHTAGHGHASVR